MKQLFLLLVFSPLLAHGQMDTGKVVTRYKSGDVKEEYTRNANGDKHGAYVQYSGFRKKHVVGQYENGVPVGVWEYYSSDTSATLVQKLDFTAHKELYVDSLRVHTLICGPRYFGGNMLKLEYIQQHIKTDFTAAEKELYKGQSFTVIFVIDEKTLLPAGATCNATGITDEFRKKMEKAVMDMPAWLPPVCKDKEEVWRFSVTFVF